MFRRAFALALVLAVPATMAGCASILLKKHEAPDLHVDRSPEHVARGEYLVKHVAACVSCHSPVNAAHQPVEGKEFVGGREFAKADGIPGAIYSTNLTSDEPSGLGKWTDGEIVRAIREGVDKDGQPLFPIMPYENYRSMSDDDVQAIVAYLRSLKPVHNEVAARKLDFPMSVIVNVIPKPVERPVAPAPVETMARGQYLFTQASCAECHTPRDNHGQKVAGKDLAGGMVFPMGEQKVVAPNITQDKETGIGGWTDDQMATALMTGLRPDGKAIRSVMPWPEYSGMDPKDIRAIVTYMKTLKPVKNDVGPRW